MTRQQRREEYLAEFEKLPDEEQRVHCRVAIRYLIALMRGSTTPLQAAVAGESEELRARTQAMTTISAPYTVSNE